MKRLLLPALALVAGLLVVASCAQKQKENAGAENATLSILEMSAKGKWEEPVDPVKIVGPIYYVGTKGLASYLIDTGEGLIVLNTGMPTSGPMIEESIRKLGFDPTNIRLILTCHAHIDHMGGHAYLKKLSAAQVAVMDRDVSVVESGGKSDFEYGSEEDMHFDPVIVERVLHDGDTVVMGDVALKAWLTAGHTKGSTTWVTKVTDGEREYNVVFPDGTSVNPGYHIVRDPSYEGIEDDYRHTFQTLAALKPDIWLPPHPSFAHLNEKRERAEKEGVAAWVDPDGYAKWVAEAQEKYQAARARELAAAGAD